MLIRLLPPVSFCDLHRKCNGEMSVFLCLVTPARVHATYICFTRTHTLRVFGVGTMETTAGITPKMIFSSPLVCFYINSAGVRSILQ